MVDFTKVFGLLETIRAGLMWVATQVASFIDVPVENIYLIVLIVVSLWVANKVFKMFFSTIEGRATQFWILVGAIFYVLNYLNVN